MKWMEGNGKVHRKLSIFHVPWWIVSGESNKDINEFFGFGMGLVVFPLTVNLSGIRIYKSNKVILMTIVLFQLILDYFQLFWTLLYINYFTHRNDKWCKI